MGMDEINIDVSLIFVIWNLVNSSYVYVHEKNVLCWVVRK